MRGHWTKRGFSALLATVCASLVVAGCGSTPPTATPAPTKAATAAPVGTQPATTPTPAASVAATPTVGAQAKYGGTLSLAQTADPPTFNVYGSTMALVTNHTHLTHSRLLRYKSTQAPENAKYGDLTVTGDLAESWTVSGDGTVFTMKLRHGVQWANVKPLFGREFTSADVIGSWDRMRTHPKSVFKGDFGDVTKTEAVDRYTVSMTIGRPLASWIHRIADGESAWMTAPDFIDSKGVASSPARSIPSPWPKRRMSPASRRPTRTSACTSAKASPASPAASS